MGARPFRGLATLVLAACLFGVVPAAHTRDDAGGARALAFVVTGGVAAALVPLETEVLAGGRFAFARALTTTRVRIVPGDKTVAMRGAAALVLYERGLTV